MPPPMLLPNWATQLMPIPTGAEIVPELPMPPEKVELRRL